MGGTLKISNYQIRGLRYIKALFSVLQPLKGLLYRQKKSNEQKWCVTDSYLLRIHRILRVLYPYSESELVWKILLGLIFLNSQFSLKAPS
jgi:hypothetical protein